MWQTITLSFQTWFLFVQQVCQAHFTSQPSPTKWQKKWLNPVTHMLVLHLHIDFIMNSNLCRERACARSQECLNTTCFTKRQRGRHLNLYQLFFSVVFFLMSRDRNFKCTYVFPCISYLIYFCPFEHKGLTLFENGKFV